MLAGFGASKREGLESTQGEAYERGASLCIRFEIRKTAKRRKWDGDQEIIRNRPRCRKWGTSTATDFRRKRKGRKGRRFRGEIWILFR